MAAAALMRADFSSAQVLLDPMCGAGTFSLEAALMVKNIPRAGTEILPLQTGRAFVTTLEPHTAQAGRADSKPGLPPILASDIDPEACRRLDECVRRCSLSDAVSVACRIFSSWIP